MSAKTVIQLKQLAAIAVAWVLVAIVMSVYDYLVLNTMYSQGPSSVYTFQKALLLNVVSAIVGASLGGSLLVFYVNVKFIDKPFIQTVIAVTFGYGIVIVVIICVITYLSVSPAIEQSISYSDIWTAIQKFLSDAARIKNIMIWYFIVALTQISLQVSSKFGFKTFSRIVRGVYNVPHEEEKVVMFVDINGSTAIAEELGKERYYNFLKDFFSDIADPILNNAGQIYQYVGDEVVIVWNYEAGSDYSCCAQCFFDIKAQIEKKREKYLRRYGTVPTFKGAIHAGTVIAGEVGTIKREITYSGDVLNTTSRMQSLCGKLNSELLVSSQLLAAIDRNRYDVRPLGSFKLRGKDQEIFLQSLTAA